MLVLSLREEKKMKEGEEEQGRSSGGRCPNVCFLPNWATDEPAAISVKDRGGEWEGKEIGNTETRSSGGVSKKNGRRGCLAARRGRWDERSRSEE